jgi:transcriptional regulator with XRE-family HTH domain
MNTEGETINQRIELLIRLFDNGNQAAFARRVKLIPSAISNIIGGRMNNPGFEAIQKIVKALPTLNRDWFLLGEGEMLTEATEATSSSPPTGELAIVAVYVDSRLKVNPDGFGLEIASKEYQGKVVAAIRTILQLTGALPVAGDYLEFDESESLEITHRYFQFGLDPEDSSSEVRVFYRYRKDII